ncbi:MAG: glucosyl-3-phosphoglycerate synthase [Actinomycetota bacterium]|nr:glucosyl-3-phosphoglycerate synthase [Actinomycetota bacterium]
MIRHTDHSAESWFSQRTFRPVEIAPEKMAGVKARRGERIGVCLPALDEAETIGPIVSSIRSHLVERSALVDELIVIDSGSRDGTAEIAGREGAIVHRVQDLPPEAIRPSRGGKGEALWRSVAVASSDLVVWLDADLRNFGPHFVTNLVWPLLLDESLVMVKGFYERPLSRDHDKMTPDGARVTEIAARPLLQLLYPKLKGVIQPLAGECAIRRAAALEIPFTTGYGVDIGLLIEVVERYGLFSLGQSDLGTRIHRNRDVQALGRTAFQVMQTVLGKLRARGKIVLAEELSNSLVQFAAERGQTWTENRLEVEELPPLASALESSGT